MGLVSVGLRVPANEMVGLEYEVGMVIAVQELDILFQLFLRPIGGKALAVTDTPSFAEWLDSDPP